MTKITMSQAAHSQLPFSCSDSSPDCGLPNSLPWKLSPQTFFSPGTLSLPGASFFSLLGACHSLELLAPWRTSPKREVLRGARLYSEHGSPMRVLFSPRMRAEHIRELLRE